MFPSMDEGQISEKFSALRVVRYQIEKDIVDHRQQDLKIIMTKNKAIGWAFSLITQSETLSALCAVTWGALNSGSAGFYRKAEYFIYWSSGEKKPYEFLKKLSSDRVQPINLANRCRKFLSFLFILANLAFHKKIYKLYRISKKLNRKHGFFAGARAIQTLCSLFFFRSVFKDKGASVFISTESNPHGTAIMELSRVGKLKCIFWAHSPWVVKPMAIHVDVGVFWGADMWEKFLINGSTIKEKVYFCDKLIPKISMQERSLAIVALSKTFSESYLRHLVEELCKSQTKGKYEVKVKPHPNSLQKIPKDLIPWVDKNVDTLSAKFVIAGNTTFHLEVLASHIPSFYAPQLDHSAAPLEFIVEEEIRYVETLAASGFQSCDVYPANFYDSISHKYFSSNVSMRELRQKLDDYIFS